MKVDPVGPPVKLGKAGCLQLDEATGKLSLSQVFTKHDRGRAVCVTGELLTVRDGRVSALSSFFSRSRTPQGHLGPVDAA